MVATPPSSHNPAMLGSHVGVPATVPEDDVSPFERIPVPAAGTPDRQAPSQKKSRPCSCCFGGSKVKYDEADSGAATPAPHVGSVPLAGRLSQRLSHRDSTKRPSLRKMGSLAYSDAEWFDAASRFEGPSGDHGDLLAEVDQLTKQLSLQQGPWVPDPPLRFAGDMPQRFLPHPLDVSRFCGYWARDYDRSTPPPQPIDVMLKLNFFTRKVHDSIGGAMVWETDKEMHLLIKPTIVPPGLNKYEEVYDKLHAGETSWMLRRDLRPGSSSGRMHMAVDGTLITTTWTRGMMSSTLDVRVEEYWRLEEGGNVLVCRQCCYHIPTGKTAVQFLVGIKQPHPPKGWPIVTGDC